MEGVGSQSLLKRQKVEFHPDEPITHLSAGKNHVAIATRDKSISIITTSDGKQTDCDLNLYLRNRIIQAKIYKLFLDPTGKFTFISLAYATDNQPLENLLFVKRLQALPRLKNHLISAIAWNYPRTVCSNHNSNVNDNGSPNSTGTILLGTTKGIVLQAEFIHSDESKFFPLSAGPRQYVKEVFDIGSDFGAITGLEYHQVPSNSSTERTYIIFISTNSRLYRMIGNVPANVDPPPLGTIFAQNSTHYKDVPGRFINSKLDFFYPAYNSPPVRYAWLTEPAVMTGELQNQLVADRAAFESSTDMITLSYDSPDEIDLPLSSSTPLGMSPSFGFHYKERPISIVTTNFHVIVLFRTYIKAICILNSAIVYEEYLPNKYGDIHGMAKDPVKNTIWVFCERAIFKYKISNENKSIWRIYLEQKKFDLAKKYSINDESNYDRVLCEEAQHYFTLQDYDRSAHIFAQSRKPFEDISLMFMEIGAIKALRKYLSIKLEQFESKQTIQMTMTLAWLLELIISDISVKRTERENEDSSADCEELNDLQDLLSNKQVLECFHKYPTLFYGIIRNYSDQETFVRLAKLMGDFGHVVEHYMDLGEYGKALDIMKVIKRDDLFYTYGHILMKRMPKELVDAFMEQPTITPDKLIPVLIQENAYFNKCSETIRYLEFCIHILKSDSRVIHNYLFELYARYRDEDTLIRYLEEQVQPGGSNQSYLDLQLCLRLCTDIKLFRTCVSLYSSMGLFDEALDLALTFDIELAKNIANKAESDDHQKQLWLTIAQRVLTDSLDIRIATNLLKECRLLKIEDILPFFPDYTTIDFFKDAIRQSLQEYKNQIMSLKDGTFEKIADDIRNEIKTFRNRYSIIKVGQRCEICSRSLQSMAFYVFPCGHLFHKNCIIKEIVQIDPNYMNIDNILKQLGADNVKRPFQSRQQTFLLNSTSSQTNFNGDSTDRMEDELEQIISSECIYCGSLLPNYIDKQPFLATELDDCLY